MSEQFGILKKVKLTSNYQEDIFIEVDKEAYLEKVKETKETGDYSIAMDWLEENGRVVERKRYV